MKPSFEPLFNDRNELVEIRVGDASFATGGGDIWTAVFANPSDLTRRIEVHAGEATVFERETATPRGDCGKMEDRKRTTARRWRR